MGLLNRKKNTAPAAPAPAAPAPASPVAAQPVPAMQPPPEPAPEPRRPKMSVAHMLATKQQERAELEELAAQGPTPQALAADYFADAGLLEDGIPEYDGFEELLPVVDVHELPGEASIPPKHVQAPGFEDLMPVAEVQGLAAEPAVSAIANVERSRLEALIPRADVAEDLDLVSHGHVIEF